MASTIDVTDDYPFTLHFIKALFVSKQYRRCIRECQEALQVLEGSEEHVDLLHSVFVNFYRACSHDELARLMHDFSLGKVTTYNEAEIFYNNALELLVEAEGKEYVTDDTDDPFQENTKNNPPFTPPPAVPLFDRSKLYSPLENSPQPSTPSRRPKNAFAGRLPLPQLLEDPSTSDFSHLETPPKLPSSMTNSRDLQSDFSRMSLLSVPSRGSQPTPTQGRSLPRDISSMSLLEAKPECRLPNSISQTLLRPITPGHSPKKYASRMPIASSTSRSKLFDSSPFQNTQAENKSFMNLIPSSGSSLVSPMIFDHSSSNASSLEPISPITPCPSMHPIDSDAKEKTSQHLTAMQTQIKTHLLLLARAREQAVAAKANKANSQALASTKDAQFTPPRASTPSRRSRPITPHQKRMTSSRSYWSLKTDDDKTTEKQKRINAGRERGWTRERFNPEKYQRLAEQALAEL